MAVLVLGGYGFIGSEIVRALSKLGLRVIGAGRDLSYARRILPEHEWRPLDLAMMHDPGLWRPLLQDVDIVVNASGLLQDGDGGRVETVQRDAIRTLIEACEQLGVRTFVQISAAGASRESANIFMASKAEADEVLSASRLNHVILRPGLVIGRNCYGGTELLRVISAMPFLCPMLETTGPIQTVSMMDVVEAVRIAVLAPAVGRRSVDLVERTSHDMSEIIRLHRGWLGLRNASYIVRVPNLVMRLTCAVGDLLGWLRWRPAFRSNAWAALTAGVAGDASQTAPFLGREPQSLKQALATMPAGKQDRLFARATLLLPWLLVSLFVMWGASGIASLDDVERSSSILIHEAHFPRAAARAIAIFGGTLDLILAICLLYRPTARLALFGMALVTVFYLTGATLVLPALWTDPLAPLSKTLPSAVAALLAAMMIERR